MSITYTENIQKDLNNYLKDKKYTKIFILVDENTFKYCLNLLGLKFKYHVIKISGGENNKNIETVSFIWQNLLLNNADRNSVLINLGGGIISDIGGFSASAYKRGIDFINIPTTTLSLVDATIGGKTGVNLNNQKNMIGFFSRPEKIFIDVNFLKTLPEREYLNGIAEALKHGLLSDIEYFDEIINKVLQKESIIKIIKISVQFKRSVTDKDFTENGVRKTLNLGHTIGHGLESYFMDKNTDLKHGEAVIMGMISMLYLSSEKFNFDNSLLEKVIGDLKKIYTLNIYREFNNKEVISRIINDKKNNNDKILMVLLKNIGKPVFDIEITENELNESLNYLKFIL